MMTMSFKESILWNFFLNCLEVWVSALKTQNFFNRLNILTKQKDFTKGEKEASVWSLKEFSAVYNIVVIVLKKK